MWEVFGDLQNRKPLHEDNRSWTKYLNKCFFPLYINKITGTCTLLSLSIQVTCKVSVSAQFIFISVHIVRK